ncbi:hydroxymethylglutaryl-CoA lyase [Aurantimonas aggregata]|uniref:hydroxymethylglutaryl-CoA lyase n=1 Tax=Aurantimonas aggregata TaxID=2047720 RepID=A0A6L9MFD2_9HYPH|nr:hydroxymethylglutaryl-CoA lyase [Aurantimonas aggregata]NDV86554.1 hydroxymethylglutaryl-CoA lyase [Aurantimonas aggregata]
MAFPSSVRIVEVGPRDGLQNEAKAIPAETKVELIDRLAAAGCRTIEAGSFVSPRWVPQMADTAVVLSRIRRHPGVSYPVLVPNMKGLEAAIDSGCEDIAVFASASETFSRHNINCSIDESLERFAPVLTAAHGHGIKVRGYVSCVLGCPYQGAVAPESVADIARRLFAAGCYEVSLGDTIGTGTPFAAMKMVETVAQDVPLSAIALHFHDTCGQALANIYACLGLGVSVVDSAVGGLGGCPYAKGASGNVATEDLLYMLNGMDVETGVDLDQIVNAALFVSRVLGKHPNSRVASARLTQANC